MLTIIAEERKLLGRKNDLLRKEGWVPAVLYGEKLKTQSLQVKAREIAVAYRQAGSSGLVSLVLGGGEKAKSYLCLIHQVQRDPLNSSLVHVDFYHPSMKKKVTAEISLVFEGVSPAVKEKGGVLAKEQLSLEVKGLVTELPKEIKVDLTKLMEIHDKILFQDLTVGKNIEILGDPATVLVSVTSPRAVEEELEQPVEEPGEVEVEGEEEQEAEGEKEEKEEKEDKDGKEKEKKAGKEDKSSK